MLFKTHPTEAYSLHLTDEETEAQRREWGLEPSGCLPLLSRHEPGCWDVGLGPEELWVQGQPLGGEAHPTSQPGREDQGWSCPREAGGASFLGECQHSQEMGPVEALPSV